METTDDKMEDPAKSTPEEKPPIDDMTPASDGMTPEVDSMVSVADGVTPASDGMTPEVDYVTPEVDSVTPAADGMNPEVDSVTPAADGMNPEVDSVDLAADGMAIKTNNKRRLSRYDTGDNHKFIEKYCCTCMFKLYLFFSRIRLDFLDGIENNFYKLGILTGSNPFIFIICSLLLSLFGIGIINQKIGIREKQWTPTSMLDQLKHIKEFKYWNIRMQKEEDGFFSGFPKYIIIVDKRVLTQEALLEMYQVHKMVMELSINKPSFQSKFESLLSLWNYNETVIRKLTNEKILAAVNYFDKHDHNLDYILHVSKRDASGLIVEADATKMTWRFMAGVDDQEWERNFTDRFFHNNPTMFNELYPMTQVHFNDANKGFKDDMMFIGAGYTTMVFYIIFSLGKWNRIDHKVGLAITGLLCVGIGYVVTLGVCGLAGIEFSMLNHALPLLLLGIGVDDMFVIVGALNSLSKEEKELPVHEQIGLTMKHAGMSITITTLSDILSFAISYFSVFPGLQSFCIYNCVGIFTVYLMEITLFSSCIGLDLRRILDQRDALFCCYKYSDRISNRSHGIEFLEIIFLTLSEKLFVKKFIKVIVVIFTLVLCAFCSWNIFYLEVDSNYVRFLYSMDTPYYSYGLTDQKYFPDRDIGIYCRYIPYSTQQAPYLNMSDELLKTPNIDASSSQNWMMAFHRWAQTKNSINGGIVPPEKFDLLLFKYLENKDGNPYVKYIEMGGKEMCLMNIPKTPFCTKLICGPITSPIKKQKCKAEMKNIFTISCACNITIILQAENMQCMCQTPNCTDKIHKDTSTKFPAMCNPLNHYCFIGQEIYPFDRNICFNNSITYPMTKILLKMNIIDNYEEKLNLMHHLEHVIEKYYADYCVASARYYIHWKMNSVLAWEMRRNISLAFLSVFLITILMLMNWKTSLLVVSSVIFTMIDIIGFLSLWGIYVDTASCVLLTLAVGLIFDYSVHIGFVYMRFKGHKNDRMIVTLKEMGPPVFHAGFSTLIAVLPLCLGNSYPFKIFFKVMFLMIFIGLYHGLIFLPVMLSLFGPRPYASAKRVDVSNLHEEHEQEF